MKKITIIVPIYNVEQYLNRCINSIIYQTYENLEIILVDDGSTDNSSKISDEWSYQDKRIHVIHIENQGVSAARNIGIENATGDFITFVDSDDWLELDAYEKVMKVYEENPSEVLSFGYYRRREEKKSFEKFTDLREGYFSKQEIIAEIIPKAISYKQPFRPSKSMIKSVWCHLYDIDLINDNNIRFKDIKKVGSEDYCYNLEVFSAMKSYYVLHIPLYNYYERENSFTATYDFDRYCGYENLYCEYEKILKKYGTQEAIKLRLDMFWLNCMIDLIRTASTLSANMRYEEIRDDIKKILYNERVLRILSNIDTRGYTVAQKGAVYLFKIKSARLFFISYRVKDRIAYLLRYLGYK